MEGNGWGDLIQAGPKSREGVPIWGLDICHPKCLDRAITSVIALKGVSYIFVPKKNQLARLGTLRHVSSVSSSCLHPLP